MKNLLFVPFAPSFAPSSPILYVHMMFVEQDRQREIIQQQKQQQKQTAKAERVAAEEAKRRAEELSYDRVFIGSDNMTSNADVKATVDASAAEEYEDDFF